MKVFVFNIFAETVIEKLCLLCLAIVNDFFYLRKSPGYLLLFISTVFFRDCQVLCTSVSSVCNII